MPDDRTDMSASSQPNSDVDLYCLQCGYNLRGLSGDPRWCPECGYLNAARDLEIPAVLIRVELRRMESAPALSVLALLIALPCALALVLTLMRGLEWVAGKQQVGAELNGGAFGVALAAAGTGLTAAVAAWFTGLKRFQRFCQSHPGWLSLFIEYHIYTLLLCISFGGMVFVIVLVGRRGDYILLGLVAACVFAFVGGRWAHRRLRSKMEPMQREMAARIARDELRRELAQSKRDERLGLE